MYIQITNEIKQLVIQGRLKPYKVIPFCILFGEVN